MKKEEIKESFNQPYWIQEQKKGDWLRVFETQTSKNGITKKKFDLTKLHSEQNLKMGSIVITKKGFFKLLEVDGEVATILDLKTQTKKEKAQISEISTTFDIYLYTLVPTKMWYKITLNSNGNIEQLMQKINSLNIINLDNNDYSLIANGGILNEGSYYDQCELRPNMRVLLTSASKKEVIIKRFINIKKLGWYNKDHLIISTNKKMKLTGVGIFALCQGIAIPGKLNVIEGTPLNIGKMLVTEDLIIETKTDIKDCIINYYFKIPIIIAPFKNYSIAFDSNIAGYFYFGSDGKPKIDAEKNLVINFNKEGPNGILNNIAQSGRGIVAEIHYTI